MILMPMGAVIFVDFWVLPRLGLRSNFAEATGRSVNWAAGAAWIVSVAVSTVLVQSGGLQIYFVSLPGWFVAAILYVVLSQVMQRNSPLAATQPAS